MKVDESLFEDMSTMYMDEHGFPPLTSNIYTYLLFDFTHEGVTFETLVSETCASKSSVSNSLNRLLEGNYIEFFTKLDERKRYYRINKSIFRVKFLNKVHKVKSEYEILTRFANFKAKVCKDNEVEIKKLMLHIQLQKDIIKLFEDTIEKLNQINN